MILNRLSICTYGTPHKKFTFRSCGTVSLFNYVRAGTQASLRIKRNRVSLRVVRVPM